ncbi:hypothetical protein [Streptosporangium vulgare]|uniref:Uncharacterized protein n=1 Tax=Streptosporangium vulgare TaxID=46190 RepID=A0ABV5TH97_9ACTN
MITLGPVLVTVVPARTAKFAAVPSGGGVAAFVAFVAFAVCGVAATQPSATAAVRAPAGQERTTSRGTIGGWPALITVLPFSFGISPPRRIADDAPFSPTLLIGGVVLVIRRAGYFIAWLSEYLYGM